MTARTTTLKGADAGVYYVEKELGYYLDRGEPPGRWQGHGATSLQLGDTVDEESFLALMGGLDPRTDRLLGTKHTDDTDRGFDITCSAPKGVSVLFAVGDTDLRREVLDAHDTAVAAMVRWVEDHAHTRYRINGKIHTFDADGIVVASFRHHTSRVVDPQVHTHAVVVNRVMSPDGRWLALDARTIKKDQQTLSRLYHSSLRAEMTRRLGVRWNTPTNGIAEIADIPTDVLREFSQRTEAIDRCIDERIDRFEDEHDREPTLRERWRLERDAVRDTRPRKEDDTDPVTLEQDWRDRLAALGITRDGLVSDATGHGRTVDRISDTARQEIEMVALDALSEMQSTWRFAEVVREVAAAVPTNVAMPADDLVDWVENVADGIVETRMLDLSWPAADEIQRRRDGRPITEAATERVLTTPEILAQEERLQKLAEKRFGAGGVDHQIDAIEGLTPTQAQLAAAVAGERQLVLAVGPAGTGKTTALRPAVEQLRREGRAVFGVAPSAAAAEVLAVDTGVDADTLDKLLIEHRLERPPDHRYDLPAGTTVIVDETAMVSTQNLAELFDLAERRDWRLALIGDPMQFSAVGRSGMFGHLVDSFDSIELDRVHRFHHSWEAKASLRLRRGDETVVEEYEAHGRLRGGTSTRMRVAAVNGWWDAIERGETASLMAPTNAAVIELNNSAQWRRLDAGQLDPDGPTLQVGPYRLHVGDRVATRHNDRRLKTNRQLMVKNRDRWTIDAIHRDGSVTVTGRTGETRLPADYVHQHVELVYAETSHASQGRTVDRSFLFLDGPTGAAGIYVPMTRGRESNEAFVALKGEETAADVVADSLTRTWIDRPAIAVRDELPQPSSKRDDEHPMDTDALRLALERFAKLDMEIKGAVHMRDTYRRFTDESAHRLAEREREVEAAHRRLAHAHSALEEFDRLLVRRRHRAEVDAARRDVAHLPGSIDHLEESVEGLRRGHERNVADRDRYEARVQRLPEMERERATMRRELDEDAALRLPTAEFAPVVAKQLGARPTSPAAAALWDEAAARTAQHWAAWNMTGRSVLGERPRVGDDAYAASWEAAADSLERLDRALGRLAQIEPPQRSLGLSL